MKVVLISPYPSIGLTHEGRGLVAYSKSLATELARAGLEVHVLAPRGSDSQVESENNVTVHRVWDETAGAVSQIQAEIESIRPDVVHLQHELFMFGPRFGALRVARLMRRIRRARPLVTTVHGVIPPGETTPALVRSYVGRVPTWPVKWAYRAVMSFVSSSDLVITHTWSSLTALTYYAGHVRARVIAHGVPRAYDLPSRDQALRRLGLGDQPRVVFFGYLLPYKGVSTLKAAAPYLGSNGIEVVIAGGLPDSPAFVPGQRTSLEANCRSLGYVDEEDLPSILSIADTLVLPYDVGLSSSGPMALGIANDIPLVTSDVPTLAEAVHLPEICFRRGDPRHLAEVVGRVTYDSELRSRVRERLAGLRDAGDWKRVALETVGAYEDAVRHHALT